MNALVVGNPSMPRLTFYHGELEPLPLAETETSNVTKLLNDRKHKATLFQGPLATKKSILEKLPQVGIFHIATHGLQIFPGQRTYLPGALVCARVSDVGEINCTATDCLLLAQDIQQLDLSGLELAVLTSCYTGSGEVKAEGLLGLGRAFLYAGGRSAVLAMWKVPDTEATTEFMEHFYSNFLHSRRPAAALRHAMLAMLKRPEEDWASYYVLGYGG